MRGAVGLQAAWMLARGERSGVVLLQTDDWAQAGLSFRAVWLSLPAFVALEALSWAQAGIPAAASEIFVRDLLSMLIGWLGFLLLMRRVCSAIGRSAAWPRFIVAWNWCSLLQAVVLVGVGLPDMLGAPGWVGETAWLVAMGWSLWLGWFAAGLTLDVNGRLAAAVVMLDLAFELMVSGLVVG